MSVAIIMNIEEFQECAEDILQNEIPEPLSRDLNMGIVVLPDNKQEGDYNIMGEYIVDEMGNYVILYHGSFQEVLNNESREVWQDEIRETIKHELTHHIESLAGDEKLAREEEKEEEEADKKNKRKGSESLLRKVIDKLFR